MDYFEQVINNYSGDKRVAINMTLTTTNYKDLEDGKWVKVDGWGTASDARKAIVDSVDLFEKNGGH